MRSSQILNLVRALVLFLGLFPAWSLRAQTKTQPVFVSKADEDLSVKAVTVGTFTDNMSNIYARPLTEYAREKIAKDPQWALMDFPTKGVKVEALEDRPNDVKKILTETKADALLTGRLVKGPSGFAMTLILFVGPSGQPLLIEESTEAERFDLEHLKLRFDEAFAKMRGKMPYRGILLSRRGQEVTFNIGKNAGLHDGSEVSVIQILKVNRHPKKHFMISTDREILGKIRVFKADDELSFGHVIFEKEAGLVTVGMKVLPDEVVRYNEPVVTADGKAVEDLSNRPDKPVAFGEKPVEWLPEPPPQYGRVQALAGFGQYNQSVALQTAGGTDGSNSLAPTLGVSLEGWLNTEWFIGFDLRQSAFSINNALSGSSPSTLDVSLSKYDVSFGYNFLLSPDFFGPKLQLSGGIGKFSSRVTDSTPTLFSSMDYGGTFLGFLFNTPLGDDGGLDMGVRLRYFIAPGVSESVSSGNTKSVSASDFAFLVGKRVRRNFRYVGELNFENYVSDFSGSGARTDPASGISHKFTTLLLGLEYAF